MMRPYGPWRPDQPEYTPNIVREASNVVPQVGGYGPVNDLVPFSSALDARCRGAVGYNAGGSEIVFAGTETELYRINNATPAVISKSGGYSSTAYWRFCLFGRRVIATNYNDDVQTYLIGTDSLFSDLNTSAPKARTCATVGDFVVLGDVNDATDGAQDKRVHWSGFADPTSWPTPGSDSALRQQSDFQDLRNDSGPIKAIVPGLFGADALVMQERGVVRMNYVGARNAVFSFDPIEGARGCIAPNSPIISGGIVYYPSEDGFYASDGNSSEMIGFGKVDQFFLNDLGAADRDRIYGAADPRRKLFYWIYPGAGSVDGVPNRAICYNYGLKEFSLIEDWEANVVFTSYNFSRLVDDVSDLVDTVDILVDSDFWRGGQQILAFIDTDNKLSYASGRSLNAVVTSGTFAPVERRGSAPNSGMITQLWPIVDGGAPRGRLSYSDRLSTPQKFSESATEQNAVGYCPQRVRGRYFQARTRMRAGQDWNHLQGFETDWSEAGDRG